ncbi:MAG: hypothetical protein JNJ57_12765 [Saprospiraceae bacterium]|nr:hypothetical protein [Saprospiraceae bacterium]
MQLRTYLRSWSAGLLALVFVAFWLTKTMHVLVLHHHHDHPVCTASSNDRSEHHFHDERYADDECSICAFVFAIPELISVSVALKNDTPSPSQTQPTYLAPACTDLAHDTTHRRGPPVL